MFSKADDVSYLSFRSSPFLIRKLDTNDCSDAAWSSYKRDRDSLKSETVRRK